MFFLKHLGGYKSKAKLIGSDRLDSFFFFDQSNIHSILEGSNDNGFVNVTHIN